MPDLIRLSQMTVPRAKHSVIDIAHWESFSDFRLTRNAGVEGGICKLLDGYKHREGTFLDPFFYSHWQILENFAMRGFYVFARFNDALLKAWGYPTSTEQVRMAHSFVKDQLRKDDVVCWDVEQPTYQWELDVPYWTVFYWIAKKLLEVIPLADELFKRHTLLYTYEDYLKCLVIYGPDEFRKWIKTRQLWIAQYPVLNLSPQIEHLKPNIVLHQYTDQDSLPGIEGEVDKNTEIVPFHRWYKLRGFNPAGLLRRRYPYLLKGRA